MKNKKRKKKNQMENNKLKRKKQKQNLKSKLKKKNRNKKNRNKNSLTRCSKTGWKKSIRLTTLSRKAGANEAQLPRSRIRMKLTCLSIKPICAREAMSASRSTVGTFTRAKKCEIWMCP